MTLSQEATNQPAIVPGTWAQLYRPASSRAGQWMNHLAGVPEPASMRMGARVRPTESLPWPPASHLSFRDMETLCIIFCNAKGNPQISGHPPASLRALPHSHGDNRVSVFLVTVLCALRSGQKSSGRVAAATSARHALPRKPSFPSLFIPGVGYCFPKPPLALKVVSQ